MLELLSIITVTMIGIMLLSGILYFIFCYVWYKKEVNKLLTEEQDYAIVHTGPSNPKPEEMYGKSASMKFNNFFNENTNEAIDPENYKGFIVRGENLKDVDVHNDNIIFVKLEFKPEDLTVPGFIVIIKDGFYYIRKIIKLNKKTVTIEPVGDENKIVYFKNIFGQVDYNFKIN